MHKYAKPVREVLQLPVLNFAKEDAQLSAKLEVDTEKAGTTIRRCDDSRLDTLATEVGSLRSPSYGQDLQLPLIQYDSKNGIRGHSTESLRQHVSHGLDTEASTMRASISKVKEEATFANSDAAEHSFRRANQPSDCLCNCPDIDYAFLLYSSEVAVIRY